MNDFWSHPLTVGISVAAFTLLAGAVIAGLAKVLRDVNEIKVELRVFLAQRDSMVEDSHEIRGQVSAAHRRIDRIDTEGCRYAAIHHPS